MTYANSARRFMSMPLLAFDWVRNGMLANPRTGNYTMMYTCFLVIFTIGNGAEKLTCNGNIASKYEKLRKANRFYLPYFISDYRFKFPQVNR